MTDRARRVHHPGCPEAAGPLAILQDWDTLTFLHWPMDPDLIKRVLPSGLEVDLYQGTGWVGVVPFCMRIHLGPFPPMAPLTVFAETNVRTYVRGPDGQPGLWFLSLDVPRPALALGIRSTYRLPYLWSEMSVQVEGRRVRYRSRRHWPGPLPANNLLTVDVAEAIPPEEIGELEHFLTARCRCFTRILDRWAYVPVEHAAWPLRRAEIVEITESMVIAAGLQTPQGAPLVHYSPHVRARLGLPRFVAE